MKSILPFSTAPGLLCRIAFLSTVVLASLPMQAAVNTLTPQEQADGWRLLFDGKSLDGWVASEKPGTFSVQDGCIVTGGPRSHLYYQGEVQNHDFTNFELRLEVMTYPKSNSGVYLHTAFQETGWPAKGYEIQVNNSGSDLNSRTASLFAVQDTKDTVPDNTWFTLRIKVDGKRIMTWINDKLVTDYTEAPNLVRRGTKVGWLLSHGTFALQAHDPGSRVLFRSIAVKPLP